MKVLIPYDGTQAAENALLELQNTDLAQDDEVLIVITDVFLPETSKEFFRAVKERRLNLEKSGICSFSPAQRRLEEEKILSRRIRRRFSDFPMLNFRIETLPGASLATSEILEKADAWKADLIILGLPEEKNKTDAVHNGYTSGLRRILTEAKCPIRFARGTNYGKDVKNTDYIFHADAKSAAGKSAPEERTISQDAAETFARQANQLIEIVRSTEKNEQIPKTPATRRQSKLRRKTKRPAAAAAF